ncbi:MAG TPA: hypothetical protein VLX59_10345 [Acidimicrobiales bacterium]|nr:hypothetical protein [Acidimicrobiales bacterium]
MPGGPAPRDYSVASGGDAADPVTVAEQLAPESLAARAGRENDPVAPDPSFDDEEPEVQLVDSASAESVPEAELEREAVERPGVLPAEEAAVHLRDENNL